TDGGTSCSPIDPAVINREEATTHGCAFNECPIHPGYALCYGANVLTFGSSESVLATNLVHAIENSSSVMPIPPSTANVSYLAGHLNIGLAFDINGSGAAHPPLVAASGQTLLGLPPFGLLAMRY